MTRGLRAYAVEQVAMWNELGQKAETLFLNVHASYTQVWESIRC